MDNAHSIESAWVVTVADVVRACPLCGERAIVELPPALKAVQPDNTALVCHPGLGGCNHGFAVDVLSYPVAKKRPPRRIRRRCEACQFARDILADTEEAHRVRCTHRAVSK